LNLVLPFRARGHDGQVSITLARNDDPLSIGCDASAVDFPACTATVEFDGVGYNALFGWVQLVGETTPPGSRREFAVDPLQVFEGIESPYAWYGLSPTLFDGPSRRDRHIPLDWLALSFLCFSPTKPMSRDVAPLVGFSWGFIIGAEDITVVEPLPLTAADWDTQRDLLSQQSPRWRFLSGSTFAS
jgi:hypothetical protein